MNRIALAVLSFGVCLLLVMTAVYVLVPGDASLDAVEEQRFHGLDQSMFLSLRGLPVKMADDIFLLLATPDIAEEYAGYNYTITRMDLDSGATENTTLELPDDRPTYVRGLLGEGGDLYAYGWRIEPVHNVSEVVLWHVDAESMQLSAPWTIPGLMNDTTSDLLIEDGILYKMPGYRYALDDDGENVTKINSSTIMKFDVSSQEMLESFNVSEELCDSDILPIGDVFFCYWTSRPLSMAMEYDPETGTLRTIDELDGYEDFQPLWGDATVAGDVIVFPYMAERRNYTMQITDTVLALDRSYDVTLGKLLPPEGEVFWILSGCTGDGGGMVLRSETLDGDTSMDMTAHRLDYRQNAPLHPLLFSIPLIVILAGVALMMRKEKK